MKWRRPAAPVLHRFAVALLLIGVVEGVAGGYTHLGAAPPWVAIAAWALSLGGLLGATLGLPLVRALGLTEDPQPGLGTWLAFYACHLILPTPLLLAREALLQQVGLSSAPFWQQLLLMAAQWSYVPFILAFMEHEAHVHRACLEEDQALDQALRRWAATRFGLGQVLQGQRAELLEGMQRQLLPALARLEARAQALDLADLPAWASLMGEVEGLANQEVRAFSHRLHPEAIRFGLVPALRALFADPEVARRADLWVHAGLEASPALAAEPQTKANLLGLYRVVEGLVVLFLKEAEPEAFALVELRWADAACLELLWQGGGAWPKSQEAERALAWRLVEARVAMLGGALRVEEAPATGEDGGAGGRQLLLRLPWA